MAFFVSALAFPRLFAHLSERASSDQARLLFAILADVSVAFFFVAIACFVIGALRNRRWRKEAERANSPSAK
jgi:hypothetical protein